MVGEYGDRCDTNAYIRNAREVSGSPQLHRVQ
jgi:hypothetical protein